MCMIEYADERYGYCTSKVVKARKSHKCTECHREIAIGEGYENVHAGGNGLGPDIWKTCSHCMVARKWLDAECGGWLYAGVYEDLREHQEETTEQSRAALLRFIVGMRKKWKYGNGRLMPVPTFTLSRNDGQRG